MAQRRSPQRTTPNKPWVYELEVGIRGGPFLKSFARARRVVWRTIEIRGDQTLEDLHDVIFAAFDRFDPHMYEFQLGGKKTLDPNARRYIMPEAGSFSGDERVCGLVTETTLDDLKLKEGETFAYWFDFGDDWWHQIIVKTIKEAEPDKPYPRITTRTGESPPQYPDVDEEEWEVEE